jgi:hypothetical protein
MQDARELTSRKRTPWLRALGITGEDCYVCCIVVRLTSTAVENTRRGKSLTCSNPSASAQIRGKPNSQLNLLLCSFNMHLSITTKIPALRAFSAASS